MGYGKAVHISLARASIVGFVIGGVVGSFAGSAIFYFLSNEWQWPWDFVSEMLKLRESSGTSPCGPCANTMAFINLFDFLCGIVIGGRIGMAIARTVVLASTRK